MVPARSVAGRRHAATSSVHAIVARLLAMKPVLVRTREMMKVERKNAIDNMKVYVCSSIKDV